MGRKFKTSFELHMDYAVACSQFLVQSKHGTQTAGAVLVFFDLSASQNKFCLLLKTKNPALSCWVLFVTQGVDKSNFYGDLDGVGEFPLNTNH
jgi:hypothetical protein